MYTYIYVFIHMYIFIYIHTHKCCLRRHKEKGSFIHIQEKKKKTSAYTHIYTPTHLQTTYSFKTYIPAYKLTNYTIPTNSITYQPTCHTYIPTTLRIQQTYNLPTWCTNPTILLLCGALAFATIRILRAANNWLMLLLLLRTS